jgi:hypothetical protein
MVTEGDPADATCRAVIATIARSTAAADDRLVDQSHGDRSDGGITNRTWDHR